jgi:hypothetical protein
MKSDVIDRIKDAKSIHVGGPVVDSRATFCIYARDIDLDTITSQLGIRPTEGVRCGEIIGHRQPSKGGHWFLKAPEE